MFKSVKFGLLCVYAATSFVTASGQEVSMHGGQQPIVGAHDYLLTPSQSTTPGTASVSLLTSGAGSDQIGFYVVSDSNGDVTFPHYTCPSANAPVYFYGSGGNTGYGPNTAITEVVYVGPCGTINSQTFVYMDEVTTVAMAYAVAGYATDPVHISYSGSQASLTGIENAFANANNLASSYSEFGSAYNTIPSGNAMAPGDTVNTLADAIASCINQTSGATNCSTLFSAAPVNGNGVAATDTATAVMNIAHNPASSTSPNIQNGTNITSILTLANAYQQYLPILTTTPNDLTLGLTFYGGSIAYPTALAIDGSGNAWIASQPSSATGASSVVEISNPTTMQANNMTYSVVYPPQMEPNAIAVDAASQNIWIGTYNAVEEFSTTTGEPASGSPFLVNAPDSATPGYYGINLDSAGNVWIAGYSTIYELSATGSVLSPSPSACGSGYCLPAGANAEPSAIALDASNHVWVTDFANNALIEFNSQGTVLENLGPSTTSDFNMPYGVAINGSQDAWVANGNNYATEYIPNGQIQFMYVQADTPPAYTTTPSLLFVGIDGAGNSWFSLQSGFCSSTTTCLGVAEVSGAGRPLSGSGYTMDGFQPTGSPTASATAIDGSGDVWIINNSAETVTELIGAAVPVVTPLALAVSSNSIGSKP